jgi:glycosyltransferase involved in cell wall biosynthesis
MAKPLVTIITPTHGRARFLPLIYSCVQSQNWPNIEWLVDDDSPAPSGFMQNLSDPRVHYFHDPHRRSVGAKRNALVARARGDFIAHFDDDDYYSPRYLSHLIAALTKKDVDFVKLSGFFLYSWLYHQLAYWDLMITTGFHFIWSADPEEGVVLTPQNNKNFVGNYLGYGFSYLYKREVGERIKFPDVSWNEDGPFIALAAERGTLFCLPDTTGLCLHILHGGSSSKCFPQFVIPDFIRERLFPEIGAYWQALVRSYEEGE